MYSRQEISTIKKKFWTRFGQYMKPVGSASGETVNWVNYKTGIKHLYFRMDADNNKASIAIELQHPDLDEQQLYFEQFMQLRKILAQHTGEEWQWRLHDKDEDGVVVSRIINSIDEVNILKEPDWPLIISFLKPRIIALDEFWDLIKEGFS